MDFGSGVMGPCSEEPPDAVLVGRALHALRLIEQHIAE